MREFLPLMIVGAIVGVFSVIFVTAYLLMRRRAENAGFPGMRRAKKLPWANHGPAVCKNAPGRKGGANHGPAIRRRPSDGAERKGGANPRALHF